MNYCTVDDLVETYSEKDIVQLTDRTNKPPTTIDNDVVGRAIADAEAEINLHLMARYKLPLASVPLTVRRIAVKLAYYNLHTRIQDDHPAAREAKEQRKLLDGIATGKLSLGLDQTGAPTPVNDTVQISAGRDDWANRW